MKDKINDSMQKEQESLTVYETAETVETGEHFDASQGSKQTTNRAAENLKTELKSYTFASLVGMILLLVLYITQMLLGKGGNYGMCAVIFGLFAVQRVTVAVTLKRRNDRITAAFYAIAFILVLVFYIVSLFRSVT
jgi:hypothetical protein